VATSRGQNFILEPRGADGKIEQLSGLADELVRLKVDLIFAVATPAARAAQKATTTIPIVAMSMGDPVGDGLVTSLARPGGNITGSTFLGPALVPKRLALLKETLPAISRVGALWHPGAVGGRAEALLVFPSPMLFSERRRIAELAAKYRLPAMTNASEFVTLGAFISYEASLADLARRGAISVDKILKGARPADLPVEQPEKFELVINRKTAKALGVTIPPSLLLRADQVID
jgi:putative ABC transport system substrate-binding protein